MSETRQNKLSNLARNNKNINNNLYSKSFFSGTDACAVIIVWELLGLIVAAIVDASIVARDCWPR